MAIDYARMKRVYPIQKSRLTKAKNRPDPRMRYAAVLKVCTDAVREWNEIGAWPDGWATWQIALVDAANAYTHATGVFVNAPRLEDL